MIANEFSLPHLVLSSFRICINFSRQLIKHLEKENIDTTSQLNDPDIDIILLTEPRRYTESSSFNHLDIKNYILEINKDVIVINRINECDERKNSKGLNKFLISSSQISDHTIFISDWLSDLFIKQGFSKNSYSTIHNGADGEIFFPNNRNKLSQKLKIVTHHWGNNENKGFKVYKLLDELLDKTEIKENFEFTYVGNLPENLSFKNVQVLSPMNSKNISEYLRNCDIYITGSENEPAGMHHIEGAMCGLPLLYMKSGGVNEYCENYGIEYNIDNLEEKLFELKNNYQTYKTKLVDYKFTGKSMVDNYFSLFKKLYENKKDFVKDRNKIKNMNLQNQYKILSKDFFI